MVEFGKEFEDLFDDDTNWKKFWEALVERNEPIYDGDDVVEIYKEISGFDDEEAIDELWEYFDNLFCYLDKKVKWYDLEKASIELESATNKLLKNYLVTIKHNENMCDNENLFEYDFKITIEKASTSREEFFKKTVDKFSSVEELAKWVYDNSSPLDKLFEEIEK